MSFFAPRRTVHASLQIVLFAFLLCLLETATAQSPAGISLLREEAERIRGIRLNSAIPQDDIKTQTERFIRTQVVNTTPVPTAGGILGAIIGAVIADAIVNSQIQKRMEQSALAWPTIVENVADFDFRKELWSEIDGMLNSGIRFKIADKAYFKGERPYMDNPESIRGIPLDAILDLHTEYILGLGMKTMQVSTKAVMRTRQDDKEIYRANYTFTTPPVSTGDYQDAANNWAANKGELYRSAMRLAAIYTARMLWLDMLGPNAPTLNETPPQMIRVSDLERQETLINIEIGNVVERNGDIIVARDNNGNLRTVMRGKEFRSSIAVTPQGQPPSVASPTQAQVETGLSLDDLKDLLPAN